MEGVVNFSSVDQGSRETTNTRTEGRLTLRNVGAYFFDPGLIRLTLGGTFGHSQEWVSRDGDEQNNSTNLWGYEASTHLLSGQAVSLNLFANRKQNFLDRELAGTTDLRTENWGATVFARRLYIPSQLTFRQEIVDQKSHTGAVVSRIDQQRNIIRYEAQRGWVNSEMNLRYQFTDLTDEFVPANSYQIHEGSMLFGLDFGTELNWHWDSRLGYVKRTGAGDLTSPLLDQLLRIDHTEQLETRYRYFMNQTETPAAGTTTTHLGTFTLRYQWYRNFATTFGVEVNHQTPPGGKKRYYGGKAGIDYTRHLPGEGRLRMNLGGDFRYEDNDFDDPVTSQPNERHTFIPPDPTSLQLDNPFVIQSSVVVTKVATGPLPPGCNPFPVPQTLTVGVDYTLKTNGDLTEIVPTTCSLTTAGINPRDTISVDYQYTVSTDSTFTTTRLLADMEVDYGWIRPYFAHEQQSQDLLKGRDEQFLEDWRRDTLGVELRYDKERLRASLVGEAENYDATRQAYNRLRSNQFVRFSILPELTLVLTGDQTFTDFSNPEGRQTTTLSGRATLTYALNSSLSVEPFVDLRNLTDTFIEDELVTRAGLKVRYLFRDIEILPSLDFINQHRGSTDTTEIRANLRIIRRF